MDMVGREHKLITREKIYDGLREKGGKQRVNRLFLPPLFIFWLKLATLWENGVFHGLCLAIDLE